MDSVSDKSMYEGAKTKVKVNERVKLSVLELWCIRVILKFLKLLKVRVIKVLLKFLELSSLLGIQSVADVVGLGRTKPTPQLTAAGLQRSSMVVSLTDLLLKFRRTKL